MTTPVKSAMVRMKRRAKLPSGDRIVTIACPCGTPILVWNDDPYLSPRYPYRRLCTYCQEAEKNYNRVRFTRDR